MDLNIVAIRPFGCRAEDGKKQASKERKEKKEKEKRKKNGKMGA